jgi:hypothetical protein
MRTGWGFVLLAASGCGGLALDSTSAVGDAGVDAPRSYEGGIDVSPSDTSPPPVDAGKESRAPVDSGVTDLVTIVADQSVISGIAVSASHVYWSTFWPPTGMTGEHLLGTIMQVPIGGGTPTQLATAGFPEYLGLDSTNLYWTEEPGPYASIIVMSLPLTGGTPTTLSSQENDSAMGCAISSAGVYWAAQESGVFDVPIGGGTLDTIAFGPGYDFVGIGVDSTNVYWTSIDTLGGPTRKRSVVAAPLGGGAPVTLATVAGTEPANVALAVNSVGVYIGGGGSGIVSVPKGGGTVATLASSEPAGTANMTVDEENVYWIRGDKIMKVPLAGGSPVTLASGEEAPNVIAVDATSVYWGTDNLTPPYAGATIKRLTPK